MYRKRVQDHAAGDDFRELALALELEAAPLAEATPEAGTTTSTRSSTGLTIYPARTALSSLAAASSTTLRGQARLKRWKPSPPGPKT